MKFQEQATQSQVLHMDAYEASKYSVPEVHAYEKGILSLKELISTGHKNQYE